ncbi:hypothetical protein ACIBK8_28555 [Streptomyces sp. NPDC050161]|uniref:hypothetical protein n=1 Tax=Streptomyces sp. NPDC050161 TaxID=3365604 RepID=UPI0037AB8A7E
MSRWHRRAGIVTLLALAVAVCSCGGAWAADGAGRQTLADGGGGGIFGPFNTIKTSDGAQLSDYELSDGDDGFNPLRFLMSGLFALSRSVVGFSCWLIDWVYRFPVLDHLAGTAQHVADAYAQHIVAPLGLAGVFTAWAFAFGLVLVFRGRAARGFGEIVLTLLIAALAATSVVRPDVMLGYDGPLQQAQRAALEAAAITTQSTTPSKSAVNDPCALISGPAKSACVKGGAADEDTRAAREKKAKERSAACAAVSGPARDVCLSAERPAAAEDVSRPITRTLTDTLVVQPYQLLQYGQLIGKDSPMYQDYKRGLDHKAQLDEDDPCASLKGPARQYCGGGPPDKRAQKDLAEKHGAAGKAAASYMSEVTWDRVLGALFVLAAAVVLLVIVLAMALAMIAAQFACVLAAAVTSVVFMWALLPGPNRAVLWKWVGVFATSTVLLFSIAVFIPLFGVAAKALLADSHTVLLERLFLLDALALTALVAYRRMTAKGGGLGHAFAARMRFAKIGGSHTMGDEAAGMGMALAAVGAGRGGGSDHGGALSVSMARSSASPAHAALAMRRAKLSSGLASFSDSTGMAVNPAGALGEARAEARRAVAPLSVPMRAAQIAWTGPPREMNGGARGDGGPDGGFGGRGPRTSWVVDSNTGEVISDADQGSVPVGEQLREHISRTRGGRVLLGAGRVAWHSTVGAPAGWTRLRRKTSGLTREMDRQLAHYGPVRERWGQDSRSGLRDAAVATRPLRRGVSRAMEPLRKARAQGGVREHRADEGGGRP